MYYLDGYSAADCGAAEADSCFVRSVQVWEFAKVAAGSTLGSPDSLGEGGWDKATLEAAAFGLAIGGGCRRSRKGVLK